VREGLEELDVTRVVLVQADDTDEDTAHLQTTARDIEEHAQRTGTGIARADVVGWLPLADPDAVRDALADPRRTDHLVGVRHLVLTVVLDHLGKPPLGDLEAMPRWKAQLAEIAACPNVVAKISGLATSGNGDFAAAADLALSLFGADRLMIGSDWPIAPTALDLDSGFAPVLAHVRTWDQDAVRAVSRETAARVYRRLREEPAA